MKRSRLFVALLLSVVALAVTGCKDFIVVDAQAKGLITQNRINAEALAVQVNNTPLYTKEADGSYKQVTWAKKWMDAEVRTWKAIEAWSQGQAATTQP